MHHDNSDAVFSVRSVSKAFGGAFALRNVSLDLRPAEVLAVIGENGAGKSTLMKILAGVMAPSSGGLYCQGHPVSFRNVQQALEAGIVLIHQELNLAPNLTVGANIFLGREPTRHGLIDDRTINVESRRLMERVGLCVDPATRLNALSIARQQVVEIAKALSIDARVLIMDEPTSSLTRSETANLFQVVRQLRERGVSVVYISHRLEEVSELADRVVVLRDGKVVGELAAKQIDHDRMVQLMVGRDVAQFYHRLAMTPGKVTLAVASLRTRAFPQHALSFQIRSGEIVGLAGLVGAGRSELLTTLFGVTPAIAGRINVTGKDCAWRSANQAIDAGLALVPEDRRQAGLILSMSLKRNLSLSSLRRYLQRAGFVKRRAEDNLCAASMQRLRIKAVHEEIPARLLSGGNQQKVVIGKWLATQPSVLLLDEPTRGIDVAAKEEVYELLHELARSGVAVLFASSEMEEIIGLADRVLVMHQGRIAGQLARNELNEQNLMRLATGQTISVSA